MKIDKNKLAQFEKNYRATFINSLAGARQAMLIGTKSKDGNSNLAIFNSLIHIGANPPLWGFICRPETVKRDTLSNILETKEYTFNYLKSTDFEKAHQTSAKYEKELSEFSACGFTEYYEDGIHAPYVLEAPVKIGMKFEQKVELAINNTILVIGSVCQINVDDSLVGTDGFVALEKAKILSCAGLDAYYETKFINRLSYAKPDKVSTII